MSEIELTIKVPAPPEGWGEVEYREVNVGDYFWDGTYWILANVRGSAVLHLTARKLPPLWTPLPELDACLKPGWLTRDSFDVHALHAFKPKSNDSHWVSVGPEWRLNAVNPRLLPPLAIAWEKCCFKIGAPLE